MSRATALDREWAAGLKGIRLAKGVSQSALARAADIPNGQVRYSRIETGESPATIAEAIRLADALGVSLTDLVPDQPLTSSCAMCESVLTDLQRITSALTATAKEPTP